MKPGSVLSQFLPKVFIDNPWYLETIYYRMYFQDPGVAAVGAGAAGWKPPTSSCGGGLAADAGGAAGAGGWAAGTNPPANPWSWLWSSPPPLLSSGSSSSSPVRGPAIGVYSRIDKLLSTCLQIAHLAILETIMNVGSLHFCILPVVCNLLWARYWILMHIW